LLFSFFDGFLSYCFFLGLSFFAFASFGLLCSFFSFLATPLLLFGG
jgi:hypothetical protein